MTAAHAVTATASWEYERRLPGAPGRRALGTAALHVVTLLAEVQRPGSQTAFERGLTTVDRIRARAFRQERRRG